MRTIYLFFFLTLIGLTVFYYTTLETASMEAKAKDLSDQFKPEMVKIGEKAADFSLKGLDGKTYSLQSLQGKPVVINFWASWCGPCRDEAPLFVKLYEKYADKLEIYAINLTMNDRMQDVKSFVNEFGFSFPVLLDESGSVAKDYNVMAIPTTFFVDENGVIVDQLIGVSEPQNLEKKFAELANI